MCGVSRVLEPRHSVPEHSLDCPYKIIQITFPSDLSLTLGQLSNFSHELLTLLIRRESMALVLSVLECDIVPGVIRRAIPPLEVVTPDVECLADMFRRHRVPILLGNVILDDARLPNKIFALVQVDDLAAPLDELVLKHGCSREQFIHILSSYA